jgi:peptidoglycan hydrolase-like protein with peptidoglycan-binding domain
MESLAYLHLCLNTEGSTENIPAVDFKLGLGRKIVLLATLLLLGIGGGAKTATAQKLWESGDEVLRIQFRLQALGYSYVEPTGVYDLSTQRAVMDFQQRRGLDTDGVVGAQTRPVLFATFDPIFGTSENFQTLPSLSANPPNLGFPPEGATYPPPSFPTPALELAPANPSAVERVASSSGLRYGDRGEEVRTLQIRLGQLGYYYGENDGIYGVNTQDAVARFQVNSGISPDGIAGAQTLAALGLPPVMAETRGGRYVVVVPGGNDTLLEVRRYVNNARLQNSRRGSFVNAGQFSNRNEAESLSYRLRAQGFDARVSHSP